MQCRSNCNKGRGGTGIEGAVQVGEEIQAGEEVQRGE